MNNDKKVKDYFEKTAKDFDDIYDNKGGVVQKAINKFFRRGMRERFNLTLQMCGKGFKTVLDVGCGTGRFCIPLAENGMLVTGIDYSEEMIKIAEEYFKTYCEKTKKDLKINYICGDFMDNFHPENKFEISLAIGVFDYLKEPLPLLKKMKQITDKIIIASFPKKFTFQMPIRKIWLAFKKCPVYFYDKKQIDNLYLSSGIKDYNIINLSAVYLVEAKI